jgi:CRISPR system Cascade subunit CasB
MSDFELDANVVGFCRALSRLDDGERAQLKRCAGKSLEQVSSKALRLFYRALPEGIECSRDIEAYFLLATLYPLAESAKTGDLGDSMRRIRPRRDENAQSLDRRMQILLDADWPRLPFLLRQAIRLLDDKGSKINWPQLLNDLLWWEHEKRGVQLRWARSYFSQATEK